MIWLIGCKGMLGCEITRQLTENKLPFVGTDQEVDITNPKAIEDFANQQETNSYFPSKELEHSSKQIKWIINCAAYTNVDNAEENEELATKINEDGARNIARLARSIGAKLIHISTDYVFDGKTNIPYTEDSVKAPLNIYGKTKSLGENEIQKAMNQYYIIRTSWLYGSEGNNFVKKMTDLMNTNSEIKVINDQSGSPTSAVDLANMIVKLIEKCDNSVQIIGKNSAPAFGIYNYSNEGKTTWYDFAKAIYNFGKKYGLINNNCNITPCSYTEYSTTAVRPSFSVLSKEKIKNALKIKIPEWNKSLERFLKNQRM